jgi:hypothetical protein
VHLTASGRRRAERIARARATVITTSLAALSPSQRAELGALAGLVLSAWAETRADARQICRLCDVHACGHHEGRCPVTNAVDAAEARR